MNWMNPNLPIAAALITVFGMFLKFVSEQRQKDREATAVYMATTTVALTAMTTTLQSIALQLERLAIRIEESFKK
jgi:hypothetical protein